MTSLRTAAALAAFSLPFTACGATLNESDVRNRPAKSSTQPRKSKTWCALEFKWTPVLAL